MKRPLVVIIFVLLGMVGCDGSADLTIINNTPGYVDGGVYADENFSFGVAPGTKKTYTVAVGEGMLDNTRVTIKANIHENASSSSRVVARDEERIHMEEDHHYEYVVPYSSSSSSYHLELRSIQTRSSIVAP